MAESCSPAATAFKSAHGIGGDWGTVAKACLDGLGTLPPGANLGLLYATDALAGDLGSILTFLRETTHIEAWAGTIGMGIASSGRETYGQPAAVILVAALPKDSFRLYGPVGRMEAPASRKTDTGAHEAWVRQHHPVFAISHGDPRNQNIEGIVAETARTDGIYLVGGLTSSALEYPQIAGGLTDGGLSGVVFAPELPVATGLSQGCAPFGSAHLITEATAGTIHTLDDRPALEVLQEELGTILIDDPSQIGGEIHAAFLVPGSDMGDYLVRNFTGVDAESGCISVNEPAARGQRLMFCRRDEAAARSDLVRMVGAVKRRANGAPKAGVYYSCVARGRHLFGTESQELGLIRDELGDIPLVGFFGNGEICHDRLYGYTGVLALFY
jgi:small ligand-binding sensory domain FIST